MPPPPTIPSIADFAEVDVEAIEAKSDHARHDLRLNAKIDPLQEPGAGCAYRLRLRRIHVLDVLGQELPVKPDGREGERHKAREWAEAEQLDEKDGKDHLLEAARQRQDTAAEVIDRRRRDVLGGSDSDRDGDGDADDGGDHGHPDAFADALHDLLPAAGKIGREECRDELRTARQAFPDARPIHLGRAEREDEIGHGTQTEEPAEPRALDEGRRSPAARRDSSDGDTQNDLLSPGLVELGQPGHAVAVGLQGLERNGVICSFFVDVLFELADRGRPVLLAVDLRQHLRG